MRVVGTLLAGRPDDKGELRVEGLEGEMRTKGQRQLGIEDEVPIMEARKGESMSDIRGKRKEKEEPQRENGFKTGLVVAVKEIVERCQSHSERWSNAPANILMYHIIEFHIETARSREIPQILIIVSLLFHL